MVYPYNPQKLTGVSAATYFVQIALTQRWKNIPACQQCWCKLFPTSCKMCAKFYAVLLQK